MRLMREKYGVKRFQEHRNDMHRSAREGFLKELAKWGSGQRDVTANINFFSKVTADDDGKLSVSQRPRQARRFRRSALRDECAGRAVDVRASAGQQSVYEPKPVQLTAWRSGVAPAMICAAIAAGESAGFVNTERYFAQ
jgi:uncharacterized protein YcgI (DUF1989 family)